jgi:2-polyprenyl-6-hydroxyphenyl methylase/3-demethylubiquinone-9 3-methyltransferase
MANFDQNELDKFSHDQAHWWDPQGEYKPLHDLNPVRLSFITSHADITNQPVIDVGCGGGLLAEAMAKQGGRVTGIDLNQDAINAALEHARGQELKVDYHCVPIEDWITEHPNQYQVLTCMELLEHVPEPEAFFRDCTQLVAPGGWMFFSTLNRNLKSFLTAIVGAEYLIRLLPKGTHHYHKLIKPSELAEWAQKAGASVKAVNGLSYNPVTRSARLTRNPSVNYIVALKLPSEHN